jgi:hypothetical protein
MTAIGYSPITRRGVSGLSTRSHLGDALRVGEHPANQLLRGTALVRSDVRQSVVRLDVRNRRRQQRILPCDG